MTTAPLSLEHIIRPATTKVNKAPVLFLLHGYGSNEQDLFSFADALPEELCIISVRAPYTLPPSGHAWYAINFDAENGKWSDDEQAISSREKITNFIEEACKAYSLDATNISLLGFSQGAILSYAVALSYPTKIKNVLALSGYMNEAIIKTDFKSSNHTALNIYASHGSVDQVIPIDWARKAPVLLTELNIPHVFEEYPVGHGVAPQNFESLNKWLKNHI